MNRFFDSKPGSIRCASRMLRIKSPAPTSATSESAISETTSRLRKLFLPFDLGALHYQEGRAQEFFRAAVERANSTPGVKSATIASNFPLGGGFARTVFPEGEDETTGYRGTLTQLDDITPGFFDALRIPLLKGRGFSDSDRKGTTPVVGINEAMAKHFLPNQEAVGKRFHFFGDPTLREVVGVVGNTVINNIGEVPAPLAYLSITQDYSPAVVRAQIQSLEPNL